MIAYPEMDLGRSMEVLGRIQSALRDAVAKSGLPTFTCSFGVSHSSVAADLDSIIRVADAGLLTAKELGRDQVVFADEELAIEVFDPGTGAEAPERRAPGLVAVGRPVPGFGRKVVEPEARGVGFQPTEGSVAPGEGSPVRREVDRRPRSCIEVPGGAVGGRHGSAGA